MEKEKMNFAVRHFLIGIGIFIAGIVLLNFFPVSLSDEPGHVFNGMGFALTVLFTFGLYSWWQYCKKEHGVND